MSAILNLLTEKLRERGYYKENRTHAQILLENLVAGMGLPPEQIKKMTFEEIFNAHEFKAPGEAPSG